MRLLYSSNAPWCGSGYGVQGQSLLPRLAALPQFGSKDNIGIFAWYGYEGGKGKWNDFTIYPRWQDSYGRDVTGLHAKNFRADIVLTLIDIWAQQGVGASVKPAVWWAWTPVDFDPLPDVFLQSLHEADMPVVFSKWGYQVAKNHGVDKAVYVPLGVEPGMFRVLPNEDMRQEARVQYFGNPSHLTLMVAANKGYPDRKAFQVQLRAWAKFAEDKPGCKLYIHTEHSPAHGGANLYQMAQSLGIQDKVLFADRYDMLLGYPAEWLAMAYNCADVLLSASMREGFGIPVIEAQACGVPVIVTNHSSLPELVRWGIVTEPADMFWEQLGSWQVWPDWKAVLEALNILYAQWEECGGQWPIDKREEISKRIHAEYAWDRIVECYWAPLFKEHANASTGSIHEVQSVAERRNGDGQREPAYMFG